MPFDRLAYTTAALALTTATPEARPCALCGGILGPVTFAWDWTDPDDATEEVHHFAAHLACEHLRMFVFDLSEWEDGEAPVVGALFENATSGTGTDEVIIDENLWRRYADGIPADQRDGLDVLRAQLEEQVRSQRGEAAPESPPTDPDEDARIYQTENWRTLPTDCDGPGDNAPTPDTREMLAKVGEIEARLAAYAGHPSPKPTIDAIDEFWDAAYDDLAYLCATLRALATGGRS